MLPARLIKQLFSRMREGIICNARRTLRCLPEPVLAQAWNPRWTGELRMQHSACGQAGHLTGGIGPSGTTEPQNLQP